MADTDCTLIDQLLLAVKQGARIKISVGRSYLIITTKLGKLKTESRFSMLSMETSLIPCELLAYQLETDVEHLLEAKEKNDAGL